MQAHRVSLSTGKVVLMRDLLIRHQELAANAVGNRYTDQPAALNLAVQAELVKILVIEVDGVAFKDTEALDDRFTSAEYRQLLRVVEKLSGVGEADPLIEVVSSGVK